MDSLSKDEMLRKILVAIKRIIPRPIKQRLKYYLENRRKVQVFGNLALFVPSAQNMFDGPRSMEEFKANG